MDRREFVAAGAVCGLGLMAGCLDDALADVTSFSATPAVVADDALEETGYAYQGTEEVVETRTVARQTVEATNFASEYTRTIGILSTVLGDGPAEADAGLFGVATTPQVGLLGEEFNPVAELSTAEIARRVESQFDEVTLDNETVVDERTVESLGETVVLETFEGEASMYGADDIPVRADVSKFAHDGDLIVVAGAYPDAAAVELFQDEPEAERIDTLVAGLEHDSDVTLEMVD
ncbi:uncharacterized protein Nmag_3601 [Natrialba magadii ATCC 43099]|uniref:Uncharacterized protein n=1 Tax=Natrialba magadii (strain ATCC 43099 / DSM 3394 / CCM 3739 / CIP 104546 / IAM 13178 / JCM 8861 / NBRC 102185 / NCIMB 2190 / MS3) TaxID=547559 RepID=D3SU62_NATMM|nr:DUF6517 family protein [Natrialba magadii]ADD07151.1 uncharacterized protein Nmag_3601 [Natrialba magadii ATCC 43099]ELY29073.1 hypothetical protein C500_12210 [Natrialba magadii ATCC 43099]